jgi:hypothetical protein
MVEVLAMAPQPRSAIAGARAATRKNGTLTLTVNVSSNSSSVAESDGPPQCHAGVVDQDVDVAVARRDGPSGQLANRRHVAQRRLAVGGAAAGLLHLGGEIGGPLLVAPGDEHVRVAGGECQGRGAADPAGRASDESCLARKVRQVAAWSFSVPV